MPTRDEQETTVTYARTLDYVTIYTAHPSHLRKLRSDSRATEVRGGEDWAEFHIAQSDYDPLKGFKRRVKPLSDEQKEANLLRLAKARAARNPS